MVALIESRARELVRQMEGQLARLDGEEADDAAGARGRVRHGDGGGHLKKSLEEMMKSVRAKARAGAQAGEYEVKAGNPLSEDAVEKPAGDGDVEMSGTEPNPNSSLSRAQIHANLCRDLRELVELGVSEMEGYDTHAADTTDMYKRALEKRQKSAGSTSAITGPP